MDLLLCGGLAVFEAVIFNAQKSKIANHLPEYGFTKIAYTLFLAQYLAVKFYRIFLYHRYFSPLRHLPTPKGNHFFFGQFINLIRADSPVSLHIQWMKQFPDAPVIRFLTFANNEILFPNSPNAHKDILQTNCYSFRKPSRWTRMVKDITGLGLATLEGEDHRAHRKMLASSFSPSSIRRLEPVFQTKAKEVCKLIDRAAEISADGKSGIIDCTDTFSKATLDIMGITSLGIEMSHLNSTTFDGGATGSAEKPSYTFHEAYNTIFGADTIGKLLMFGNMFLPTRWLPIEANRKYKRATTWLHDILQKLIRQKFQAVRTDVAEGKYKAKSSHDILSFIVEESMPGGSAEGISEDLVQGHLLQILGAGHDTSANSISWSMYILATRQDIQAKLRDEITELLDKEPSPSFADLDTLHYLNNFVREVLRVYPPATLIYRQANEDLIIDGVSIPKDTSFEIVAAVTAMNPLIWGEDAETFDPSRWDRLTEQQSSPYALAAFSNGPRICIGRQFALYEVKTILVEIIRDFRILECVEPFAIENPSLTLRPFGMKVRFQRIV